VPSREARSPGDPPIDNFSHFPHIRHGWFIYITCSRQVPPRRLNQSAPENCEHFLEGPYLPLPVQDFVVGAARPPVRVAAAVWIDDRGSQPARGFNSASTHSSERMRIARSGSCPSCATRSVCTCHYQGVSHAEWPKDQHEYAPTQTDSAICWPLKAVVIECAPPRTEGLSQRAKKL